MRRPPRRRTAFTLLEVILASTIALMLMAALYTAMEMELRRTEGGRESVERATLTRAVLNRLGSDLTPCLTQIGAKTTEALTGDAELDSELAALASIIGQNVPFQTGVVGGSNTITIYLSRVPEAANGGSEDPTENSSTTDLRRVTYWIADGGLAREEALWLTSEEAQSGMLGSDGSTDYVIAPEVTSIAFQYWDGTAWQGSWDGSTAGPDGTTPLGPPRAIEVTFTIKMPGGTSKSVRHVFAVPAAAGPAYAGQAQSGGAAP